MSDRVVAGYRLAGWLADQHGVDVYRAESSDGRQAATVLLAGPHAPPDRQPAPWPAGASQDGLAVGPGSGLAVGPGDALRRAAVVLQTLAEADASVVSRPLWAGDLDDGAVALVLDAAPGQPLEALAQARPGGRLEEAESLRAAMQHASLLSLLHGEGFSHLDQTPADLFWEPKAGRLTALGWLSVRVGVEQAGDDLLAWGETWHRLWLGAPPPDPVERALRPLSAHPFWEFLSLGTQTILERTLHPDPAARYATAQALHADLQRHLARWEQVPEALVASARKVSDPAQAMLAADLACRRLPVPPGEWLALRADLAQKARGQADRLLAEAQESLELNHFRAAWELLERALTSQGLTAADRLRIRRWQALTQAAQASTAQIGALRLALPELMNAVRLADRGDYDAARQAWDAAVDLLPADPSGAGPSGQGLRPQGLLDLQADLHGHERLAHARRVEGAGEDATADYQKVLALLRQVSYRPSLAAVIGAVEEHWQRLLDRTHRQRESLRLLEESRAALEGERFDLVVELSAKVLGLAPEPSEERSQAQRLWHLARLRHQAQAALVEPGREEAALESLAALRRAFPDDAWGQAQTDRLRQDLLERLQADPDGPAGLLLRRYFGQVNEVQTALAEAPLRALEQTWRPEFQAAQAAAQARTPAGLQQAMAGLQALQRRVDRLGSLTAAPLPALQAFRQEVLQWLDAVQRLLKQQATLRREWEAAPEDVAQRQDVLLRAQQAGVELFDEEERQVARLLARLAAQRPAGQPRTWDRTLALADEARLAGQLDLAREGYQAVQADDGTPAEAKQYAGLALKRLDDDRTADRQMADLAQTWRQRVEEMEQLQARLATLAQQVGGSEVTVQDRPRRGWTDLGAVLVLVALVWAIWQTWVTWQTAQDIQGLQKLLSTSVIPTPAPTMAATLEPTWTTASEIGPVSITFISAPLTLTVGTTVEITVVVQDLMGQLVDGLDVTFEATGGTVTPTVATTQDGLATTVFAAGPSPGSAKVSVQAGQDQRGWNIAIVASEP